MPGVRVQTDDASAETDADGRYWLPQAAGEDLEVRVRHDAHLDVRRGGLTVAPGSATRVDLTLKRLAEPMRFDNAEGADLTLPSGAALAALPGAFVRGNGAAHRGLVEVRLTPLAPATDGDAFPVPLSQGYHRDGRALLEAHAALDLDVRDPDGRGLRLRDDSTVTLTLPVAADGAPAGVTPWLASLDTWFPVDATAVLTDAGDAYVLEAPDLGTFVIAEVDEIVAPPPPPPSGQLLGAPPEAATARFTFGEGTPFPLVMRVDPAQITEDDEGQRIDGEVYLRLKDDLYLGLSEADLTVIELPDGRAALSGTVELGLPAVGPLAGLVIGSPLRASMGYELGRDLQHLDAPLQPDRGYLFFVLAFGFDAQLGPLSLSALDGSTTLVADLEDPSFYLRGDVGGLGRFGPIENVGIGVSAGGLLPFRPAITHGIEQVARPFDGHLYVEGAVSPAATPLTLYGEMVVDLDADDDGLTVFEDEGGDFRAGANGRVDVNLAALGLPIEPGFFISLGEATWIGEWTTRGFDLAVSGEIGPMVRFVPESIPIRQTSLGDPIRISGRFCSGCDGASHLRVTHGLTIAGAGGGLVPPLEVPAAELRIDSRGFCLRGPLPGAPDHPRRFVGDVLVEAFFSGDAWWVALAGRYEGDDGVLQDGYVFIDSDGVEERTVEQPIPNDCPYE